MAYAYHSPLTRFADCARTRPPALLPGRRPALLRGGAALDLYLHPTLGAAGRPGFRRARGGDPDPLFPVGQPAGPAPRPGARLDPAAQPPAGRLDRAGGHRPGLRSAGLRRARTSCPTTNTSPGTSPSNTAPTATPRCGPARPGTAEQCDPPRPRGRALHRAGAARLSSGTTRCCTAGRCRPIRRSPAKASSIHYSTRADPEGGAQQLPAAGARRAAKREAKRRGPGHPTSWSSAAAGPASPARC